MFLAIDLKELRNRIQQRVRAFALRKKCVGELQPLWFFRGGGNNQNRDLRLDLLHLSGNFPLAFVGQEVVGNHQLYLVLFEELRPSRQTTVRTE